MKKLTIALLLAVSALAPANAAWYDFLLGGEGTAQAPDPTGIEVTPYVTPVSKVVPMKGHFTFSADNVMALRLVQDNDEAVIAKLAEMGYTAAAYNESMNSEDRVFLLVTVAETNAAEMALAFAAMPEIKEVWVKDSLYGEVISQSYR